MIYEIINPSDDYTIVADDFAAAAIAACLLGRGAYGLKSSAPSRCSMSSRRCSTSLVSPRQSPGLSR